jgi:hypothetical protein
MMMMFRMMLPEINMISGGKKFSWQQKDNSWLRAESNIWLGTR